MQGSLSFFSGNQLKRHFDGGVVGVAKACIHVAYLQAAHVVRDDKSVYDDGEIARLIGNITVAAGGGEYLVRIVNAARKSVGQHICGEGLRPAEIRVRTV